MRKPVALGDKLRKKSQPSSLAQAELTNGGDTERVQMSRGDDA